MAAIDKVLAQIKYALEDMSSQNAHHEFEHLCRHLTRARICSNIRPATGPVAKGGDHGRDFETYSAHVEPAISGVDSWFADLVSAEPVAFACSLNKSPESKAVSDVSLILKHDSRFRTVHFFSSRDLVVSVRQGLEASVLAQHSITLVVHDRSAIAELLADPEVFWIAERYLSLPSELVIDLPRDERQKQYLSAREKFTKSPPPPLTWGAFGVLKQAIRQCSRESAYRGELSLWMAIVDAYIRCEDSPELRAKLIYEQILALLFGRKDISSVHQRVSEYFGIAVEFQDPSSLQDAVVLFTYAANADHKGHGGPPAQVTKPIFSALARVLETRGDAETTTSYQAWYRYLSGLLAFSWGNVINDLAGGIERAFGYWVPMLNLLEQAPLLGLDHFAKGLAEFATVLDVSPHYRTVVDKVDDVYGRRVGGFRKAELARDRAISFFRAGRLSRAIEEMHLVKLEWFTGDSLRGCVLALALLGELYAQLGLNYAAKLNYLAAWHIAVSASIQNPPLDLVPGICSALAQVDFVEGAWSHSLAGARQCVRAQNQYLAEPFAPKSNDAHARLGHSCSVILAIGPLVQPTIREPLDALLSSSAFAALRSNTQSIRASLKTTQQKRLLEEARTQLRGLPFADSMPRRVIRWAARGVRFEVRSERILGALCEEFVAIMQMAVIEMKDMTLSFKPSLVEVELRSVKASQGKVWRQLGATLWIVGVPPTETLDQKERIVALFGGFLEIAFSLSASEAEDLKSQVGRALKARFVENILFGDTYEANFGRFYADVDGALHVPQAPTEPPDWVQPHGELR